MRTALVLAAAALAGCAPGEAAPAPAPEQTPAPVRVLIVGNSYTYVNNLPAVLEGLARSATPARELRVEMVAVGGATLMQHWRQGEARRRIRSERWDYVVLQEQSLLGATFVNGEAVVSDPERVFLPGVRAFVPEIRAAGARPLLYLTWARRATPEAQDLLTAAYARAAAENQAGLIPAGLVWREVRATRPDLELFVDDGSHPSPLGTYLAALAFYTTLFGEAPAGLAAQVSGPAVVDDDVRPDSVVALVSLSPSVADEVQRAAARVWSAQRAGQAAPSGAAAPVRLPALEPGNAVGAADLAGSWTGALRFYSREVGLGPARLDLALRPCAGTDRLSGRMILTYASAAADTVMLAPVTVRDGVVSFRIPFKHFFSGDVSFRATRREGVLRGIAEYTDPATDFQSTGSWEASRAAGRAAAEPAGGRDGAAAGCG